MNNKIISIYSTLLNSHGPQGWWPINGEYKKRKKLSDAEKWEIIVGTILTQNTSWTNVEKALEELRKNDCLAKDAILVTKKEILAQYIRSAGYFNQKAERLKIVAEFFTTHPFAVLENMRIEELRTVLLSVKGIGPETADSIMLYALQKPTFVIDAYTKRIMSRVGMCKKDVSYDALQTIMQQALPNDGELYNEYHAVLVEHAKRYCRTVPVCEGCPINQMCLKKR